MSLDELFEDADSFFCFGQYKKAFKLFLSGADQGDTSCMTRLALMYAEGQGVTKDIRESISWDIKAFQAGDSSGALNAAISYKSINDTKSAEKYFLEALNLGNGEAAFELAILYENDLPQAKKYLDVCIEHENISDQSREKARDIWNSLGGKGEPK